MPGLTELGLRGDNGLRGDKGLAGFGRVGFDGVHTHTAPLFNYPFSPENSFLQFATCAHDKMIQLLGVLKSFVITGTLILRVLGTTL